ncbi:fimbria/pilus outer membrane usher protein [Erwinia sp. AnSW2-5]|uniref:fimbria/pilus outer membrane usher protein n=1 Tax=Erwinia sp. AnSW2-5 TaxID=3367692 RepID=UPI00385F08EE
MRSADIALLTAGMLFAVSPVAADYNKQGLINRGIDPDILNSLEPPTLPGPAPVPEHHAAPSAKPAVYSLQSLKGRGLDPELLKNLDRQNSFPGGDSVVDIRVNGEFKGAFKVHFNPQGQLCFNAALFSQLDLVTPDALADTEDAECYNWAQQAPDINIKYEPEVLAVSLAVPQSMLLVGGAELKGEEGGSAAIVNYDYFSVMNRSTMGSSRYSYLSLQSGVNVNNWLLRSRQQFQQSESGTSGEISSIYVQRFFPAINKIFQLGEISVSNSLFQVSDIKGIQLTPDQGLINSAGGSGVVVTGMASTPQARVEVRQYGMLIYSTLVPAGAFTLDNVPIKNRNADLEVSVYETDGQVQHFTVAASQMLADNLTRPQGYSLALGKVNERYNDNGVAPMLATLTQQWQPASWLSLQSGVLLSEKYQSLAAAATIVPFPQAQLNSQMVVAKDDYNQIRSSQMSLSANYQLSGSLTLGAGVTKSSPDFASLSEASQRQPENFSNANTQYSLSLAWSPWNLGTFSFSHSESNRYGQSGKYSYDMLSWNKRLGKVQMNVSASRGGGYSGSNQQLAVNFSLPLGRQQLSNYYRSANGRGRYGSQLSGSLSENSGYRLSTDRDMVSQEQSLSGGVNANLHYTSMRAAATRNGSRSESYSLGASGGMVLHGNGLTFSPNAVGDTFGIIELNEKIAGVEISTPGGKAWTDFTGRAIAPTLSPWRNNSIDINTESLPKKIDVANGHQSATLARGTVKTLGYAIITTNRLLLELSLANGELLPRGSRIWDEHKNFLAAVIDDGVVFLSSAPKKATLFADIAGMDKRCSFSYDTTDQESENVLYEKVTTKCL